MHCVRNNPNLTDCALYIYTNILLFICVLFCLFVFFKGFLRGFLMFFVFVSVCVLFVCLFVCFTVVMYFVWPRQQAEELLQAQL